MKKYFLILFFISVRLKIIQAQVDSLIYPVSLSSLEARVLNNDVKLQWKTACYVSYASFQIQKSINGITFSTINSFTADKIRCKQPFEFIDSKGGQGNIFYRINAGDIDGYFYNSRIVKILGKENDLEILSIYPTLISSGVTIVLSSPSDGSVKVNLINSSGMAVRRYSYALAKGVSNFYLNLNGVAKGNYWISTIDAKGKQQNLPLVKL